MVVAALASFALIAGACGNKKNDSSSGTDAPASATTTATAVTEAQSTATPAVTDAPATTPPPTEPPTTVATLKAVPGGKIIVAGEAKVASPWTPAKMQCDSYCQERARTFFDPLVALGSDNKVHPFLAESVTPNADYTVWTVKMRSGIKFTDGTDVNADAAIFNLQATGTGLLVSAALTDVAKNPDKSLKIDKVDELTFTISTGKGGDAANPVSWPTFDFYLAGQLGMIASPTWLKGVADGTADETKAVGSGPFIIDSYSDDKLVVKKNPNYWGKSADGTQLPYLDEVEFRVIDDSEVAQKALEAGDIDAFSTSTGLTVKAFRDQADKYPMEEQSNFGETGFVILDHEKPPMDDARVRCALAMAIDRQEMIDATEGGIQKPANGPFSPGQEGYLDDNGLPTAQDLVGAKALIDAYVAEKGPVSIKFGKTTSATNETRAELLKGYWESIGVNVEVQTVEQSSFITNALFGVPDFMAYLWRQHAGVNVDNQYFWWHSAGAHPDGELSLNFARIRDPKLDSLLDQARSEADPVKRTAIAEDINREFGKECHFLPIAWTIWGVPHAAKVHGFQTTTAPDGTIVLDGAGFSGSFWLNSIWVEQ